MCARNTREQGWTKNVDTTGKEGPVQGYILKAKVKSHSKAGQGQNQVSVQNLDEQKQKGKGKFKIQS